MSIPSNNQDTETKPSHEARFSTALWKLSEDRKEQAGAHPNLKLSRLLLLGYIAVLLYVLSAGPVGAILKEILPGKTYASVWVCLYYPVFFLIQHHTPLAGPLLAYLRLWGAT